MSDGQFSYRQGHKKTLELEAPRFFVFVMLVLLELIADS